MEPQIKMNAKKGHRTTWNLKNYDKWLDSDASHALGMFPGCCEAKHPVGGCMA